MKKNFIYILFFLLLFQTGASATITEEEQFSEEYIVNHGYSDEMYRLMTLSHDQILGVKPSLSDNRKIYRPWQNGIRAFMMYLDPGLDDEKFMQHKIKYTIRWDAL